MPDLFDKLKIETLVRDHFDGRPSVPYWLVDGLVDKLRVRMARGALPHSSSDTPPPRSSLAGLAAALLNLDGVDRLEPEEGCGETDPFARIVEAVRPRPGARL